MNKSIVVSTIILVIAIVSLGSLVYPSTPVSRTETVTTTSAYLTNGITEFEESYTTTFQAIAPPMTVGPIVGWTSCSFGIQPGIIYAVCSTYVTTTEYVPYQITSTYPVTTTGPMTSTVSMSEIVPGYVRFGLNQNDFILITIMSLGLIAVVILLLSKRSRTSHL